MARKDADRDEPAKPAVTPAKPATKVAEGSRVGVDDKLAMASQVAMGDTMAAGPATQPPKPRTDGAATSPKVPVGLDATMAAGPATQPPKPRGDEPAFVADATMAATPVPGSIRRVAAPHDDTLAPASAATLAESVANDATIAGGFTGTGSQVQSQAAGQGHVARGASHVRATTDVSGLELPIVDDANYERLEEFARGGLGRIIKARDRRTGRIVALKEMLGDADETAKRFAREARVTANLMHPAIVPVYELGRWPSGEPFFAMKLVAGRSLQELTSELKTLEERLARIGVIVAVADALAYAHEQRVIHRDLKPANVLVGEFGETVVIDWGLAKVVDEVEAVIDPQTLEPVHRHSSAVIEAGSIGERTMDGSVLGTPSYMPPEQALGHPADQRSDVYAIGAMLYQLITGVTPFADKKPKSLGELLRMVENESPTPVAELAPETPADLITIIATAMAPDRSARYPSARELANDLRLFTAGQLVSAHAYNRRALLKRWLKKNRAAVTVAAALVMVLAVFAVFSVRSILEQRDSAEVEMNKAKTARDHADKKTQEARDSLATALFQKGRSAESQQRWADAVMYYAAARMQSDSERLKWSAGLAEARAIVPHTRHVGHNDPVTASAISRDGERVVTVDTGGVVRLWKRADGTLLASKKLPDPLWSVTYAPDGREIAVGGDSGLIRRLSPFLEPVGELKGHVKRVWSLAYSPDGKLIASGGEDTTARIWHLVASESKQLKGHTQRVYSVSFSPDGRKLASGSDDRTLWMWDVATGTGALRGAQQNGGIRAVEFTRAGDGVVAGGWDFDLKVWPVDGTQPAAWNDKMSVHDVAVSPDGRVVISVGDTGELRFWEVSTHNLITVIDLPGGRTSTVTMSEDGRWLVTAGDNKVPVVWNTRALQRLVDAVGHRAGISQGSITHDNTRLTTVADDSTVRVWNLADGREQLQIALPTVAGKRTYCSSPLLSKEGVIAIGCDDRFIRRWDLTGRELPKIATQVYMRIMSLSPDDKTIVAGHMKGIGGQFEIATGKVIVEKKLHDHQIYGVAYAPTGHIATGSLDNTAKVWTPDLKLVREFRIDGEDGVLQVRLSNDATILAVGAQDGTVYGWNVETGKLLGKAKAHTGPIWGLQFSNDKRVIFTAGEDGNVFLWDTTTWKQVGTLDAKEGSGGGLWITSDGKLAATGYRNGALVVWDLPARKIIYRIGGNARDFGSCTNFDQQRWVDELHKEIVRKACTEQPSSYFDRIQARTHRRIANDVDVVTNWR